MRLHCRVGRHLTARVIHLRTLVALMILGAPPYSALAEAPTVVFPQARIDHVYYNKYESSTFSCKAPSTNCTTVVGRMIDERWSAKPEALFAARDFFAPHVQESFYRSTITGWGPQYRNRTCTETYTLEESPFSNQSKPCKRASLCKNDDNTPEEPTISECNEVNIPVTQEKGSFYARFINSSGTTIEDYTVRVNSRTQLTFNGPTNSTYRVTLDVSATEVKLNKDTRQFDYIPVPCASITVNKAKADRSCKVRLTIPASKGPSPVNIQVLDVTPSVSSAKYFQYEVSLQGPPEEK